MTENVLKSKEDELKFNITENVVKEDELKFTVCTANTSV